MFYNFILSVSVMFIISTTPAFADCLTLYSDITWQKIKRDEILIFKSGKPHGKIELDYGTFIYSSSDIKILDDYPCSYGSNVFLIDGDVVDVRKVEKF